LIASACFLAASGGGERAFEMDVSPAVAQAPATLTIRLVVEPDRENRALTVVADSPVFYRSSTFDLDGDNAARTSRIQYRDLPPGEYEIRGILVGSRGQERAERRRLVIVTGSGER